MSEQTEGCVNRFTILTKLCPYTQQTIKSMKLEVEGEVNLNSENIQTLKIMERGMHLEKAVKIIP